MCSVRQCGKEEGRVVLRQMCQMIRNFLLLATVFTLVFLMAGAARADVVFFQNGDHLSGTIVKMTDGTLVLKSDIGPKIEIPWAKVYALETEEPVTMVMGEKTRVHGTVVTSPTGGMLLQPSDAEAMAGQPVFVTPELVRAVNPPEKKTGLNSTGNLNAGMSLTSGNSDAQSIHVDGQVKLRDEKNRYTIGAEADQSKDDGETTEAKARGWFRYDRFFSKKWFLNTNVSVEHDDGADLRLRTVLGVGVGKQIFESDERNLSFTLGLATITEDFRNQPTETDPAGSWLIDYNQKIWKDKFQVFHTNEGLVSLDEIEDVVVTTRSGIRIPLTDNIKGTAQVNFDYDNDPPPGNGSTDTKYLFNLGYNW